MHVEHCPSLNAGWFLCRLTGAELTTVVSLVGATQVESERCWVTLTYSFVGGSLKASLCSNRTEEMNSSQLAQLEEDIQQQLFTTEERVRQEVSVTPTCSGGDTKRLNFLGFICWSSVIYISRRVEAKLGESCTFRSAFADSPALPVCLRCSVPRPVYMPPHKEPLWSAIKAPLQSCGRRAPLNAALGFMFAGAKEDGRNSGKRAAKAREQSVGPANHRGQTAEGTMESHSDGFLLVNTLTTYFLFMMEDNRKHLSSCFTWTCWGKTP